MKRKIDIYLPDYTDQNKYRFSKEFVNGMVVLHQWTEKEKAHRESLAPQPRVINLKKITMKDVKVLKKNETPLEAFAKFLKGVPEGKQLLVSYSKETFLITTKD